MNGDPDPMLEEAESAAAGTAVAAGACGHGSVRKSPFASLLNPFRHRATMRKRYVVAGSRPERVVREVRAPRAAVVGDQIP
jgi:hypothetical protein